MRERERAEKRQRKIETRKFRIKVIEDDVEGGPTRMKIYARIQSLVYPAFIAVGMYKIAFFHFVF